MFVSKEDLKLGYGVDMEIGKFFVNRRVPSGNLYWANRLLYIVPMPGFLFIPLFADIEFRIGLPKPEILSDEHAKLAEAILHSAAKLEASQISFGEHINECVEMTRPVSRNPSFLHDLITYFSGHPQKSSVHLGTPFKALNRADAYLFTLCIFQFDQKLKEKLVEAWYALIAFYLINDDLEDIRSDFEKKEENVFLEAGMIESEVKKLEKLLLESCDVMNHINPVLANRFDFKNKTTNVSDIISSFSRQHVK